MKIFTPRGLMRRVLGVDALTQPRIDRAVQLVQMEGWVLNRHPDVGDYEYAVPAVRRGTPMFRLMQATYDASREGRGRCAWLMAVEVEVTIAQVLVSVKGVDVLARHGLAIAGLRGEQVGLIGTSPMLARVVNGTRLGRSSRGGWSSTKLVQAALGMIDHPCRLTDQRVLSAAEVFELFDIDATDLLKRGARSHLYSKWTFADAHQPQAA